MTDQELQEAGVHEDALGAARGVLFVALCWVAFGVFCLTLATCAT